MRAAASATEVLKHRDFAGLSAAEKQRLAALFAHADLPAADPAYRPAPAAGTAAGLDASRTLRDEPAPAGRAGRDRVAAPRRSGRVGWCCWSTCPAR